MLPTFPLLLVLSFVCLAIIGTGTTQTILENQSDNTALAATYRSVGLKGSTQEGRHITRHHACLPKLDRGCGATTRVAPTQLTQGFMCRGNPGGRPGTSDLKILGQSVMSRMFSTSQWKGVRV